MIAETERGAGLISALTPPAAVAIAARAGAGAVAWVATSLPGLSAGLLIGILWPLIVMVFAGYVQRELNRAIGQRAPAGR